MNKGINGRLHNPTNKEDKRLDLLFNGIVTNKQLKTLYNEPFTILYRHYKKPYTYFTILPL